MNRRAARAAAIAGLLLAAAPLVRAQDRGAWGPRSWEAAQRPRAPGGGYPGTGGRGYGYGGPRFGGEGYAPPGYPRGFAPAAAGESGAYGGWRRGQVLPPAYRGAYVPDPGRYHLRAAPPGYGWVGDGRDAYLTQRSTGLVLDHVPRAYEPAPAFRRGGGGRRPR